MKILGISAFYHDSAIAIIEDGVILAAAQEEWFTRIKHDASFPTEALKWGLEFTGFDLTEFDYIAFYDKPFLKFERLLETYYDHAPRGLVSFMKAMPVWLKEKVFLKQRIRKELKQLSTSKKPLPKILFPEHHLSHAASAYYPSPFEEATILTIDGVGEWATATICHGKGREIRILKELRFPHSLGLLYSAFTYFLGFRVNFGEYKLMGLAPYGNEEDEQTQGFIQKIKSQIIDIQSDGSIHLNQSYFSYATGLRMIRDEKWEQLFGFPRRTPESSFDQIHCNLAIAIQKVTEEVVLLMAKDAISETKCKNLCLAGGVALNCVANGKLLQSKAFNHIRIQPAAGDAGGALGAALAAHYIFHGADREVHTSDGMHGAYLGPLFSNLDIEKASRKYKAVGHKCASKQTLCDQTASFLADGKVVGWFQGRQEFGPRALGCRSILGDAKSPEMQQKLNLKIKFRESFRPFAPSVLAEDCDQYFDLDSKSPYMLLVAPVKEQRRKSLPDDYAQRDLKQKIVVPRSDIPAVTHIDFSARVQTVHQTTNPLYHQLIHSFKAITGYGLVVNTSFNVRGEPVVCTPEDAFRCFFKTNMDYLVIGDYIFNKEDQPKNEKIELIKEEQFVLD